MRGSKLRKLALKVPEAFRKAIKGARQRELVARHLLLHPEQVADAPDADLEALQAYVADKGWRSLYGHDRRMYRLLRAGAEHMIEHLPEPAKCTLQFICDNRKVAGYSGRITPELAVRALRQSRTEFGSFHAAKMAARKELIRARKEGRPYEGIVLAKLVDPAVFKMPLDVSRAKVPDDEEEMQ